jgi:hypothetical protein
VKLFPFQAARRILPAPVYYRLRALWRGEKYSPPPGLARFGDLRRLTPFSREYGYDRGQPIDRYYIENFLSDHKPDIQGRVLEIADNTYTWQFGGNQVTKSEVLHRMPGDPKATIIGDLCEADHIPTDSFDCVIITQTLQVIYDVRAAIRTIHRVLKPGGVALITVPGISPISLYDLERWGYFWSFTSLSALRLFEEFFPAGHVEVRAYGNLLTAVAFLYGLATQELRKDELDPIDPAYEVIVAVRARKPIDPNH